MSIGLIWAEARDGAIGLANAIPWHVPQDLAHFKQVTMNAPVIMGRRTWDSLPERFRPLPGRENIVVSRNPEAVASGARVVSSLEEALAAVPGADDPETMLWVMGGGQLYREAMAAADVLVITRIDLDVPEADTFAPEVGAEFSLVDAGVPQVSANGIGYRFERWERGSAQASAVA